MKVTLISHTIDPMDTICFNILIMKEKYPGAVLLNLTRREKEILILETLKTRLRGALEFATFDFHLQGVSRTFTHQLVRHRVFHFSQQSMRFFDASKSSFINPSRQNWDRQNMLQEVADREIQNYANLVKREHIPIEDARSILPQNIETQISFGGTYRGLIDLAEVRMCDKTQGEFRDVMKKIVDCVKNVDRFLGSQLMAVCNRTGECEFKSIFDSPCARNLKNKKGGEENGSS